MSDIRRGVRGVPYGQPNSVLQLINLYDYEFRFGLFNSAGTVVKYDWRTQLLKDSTGINSIDGQSRQLLDMAGIVKATWAGSDFVINGLTLATGYKVPNGLSTGFLKADGSVDSSTYLTANQTITFTPLIIGDVTGNANSVANVIAPNLVIGNGKVTYAKIQNINGQRLLGRFNAVTGVTQEIIVGTGLVLDAIAGILSATGTGTGTGGQTYVGTPNRISISPTLNPNISTIDIDTNYVGQTSITTFGTITSGDISAIFNDTQHGNRGGGMLHTVANSTTAGFQSAANVNLVNSLADGTRVILNQTTQQANSNFNITGSGVIGSTLNVMEATMLSNTLLVANDTTLNGILNVNIPKVSQIGALSGFGNTFGFYVDGNYAYVSGLVTGLGIVNITNPSNPRLVSTIGIDGVLSKTYSNGRYLYIANFGNNGFRIIDISDKKNPSEVAANAFGGDAIALTGQNKFIYLVQSTTKDFKVIDVSNPSSPQIIGTYNLTATSCKSIAIYDKFVILGGGVGGTFLTILDVSNPSNPTLKSQKDVGFIIFDLSINGGTVSVNANGNNLSIYDVSNTNDPTQVLTTTSINTGYAKIYGDYLYTLNTLGDALSIYRLSISGSISLVTTFNLGNPQPFDTFFVKGNNFYLCANNGGILLTYSLGGGVVKTLNSNTASFGEIFVSSDAGIFGSLIIGKSLSVFGGISTATLNTTGTATIGTIGALGTAATTYLTHTNGLIQSRTLAQVLSDIGGGGGGGGGLSIAAGDARYILNQTTQQQTSNFNISGTGVIGGSATANSFIKTGGTATQFLKADGSVDNNTYLTSASQTINFTPIATGDVTGNASGTTTLAPNLLIGDGKVTYAKIQNVTGQRILGRFSGTAGVAQEIQIGSNLTLSATTGVLSATGGGNTLGSSFQEVIVVTALNTISPLTKTPTSFPIYAVSGKTEHESAGGAISRTGKTLTWNATNAGYPLRTYFIVVANYFTLD